MCRRRTSARHFAAWPSSKGSFISGYTGQSRTRFGIVVFRSELSSYPILYFFMTFMAGARGKERENGAVPLFIVMLSPQKTYWVTPVYVFAPLMWQERQRLLPWSLT
jgi:hypothetical protein